ncbi:MAG: glutathione synthase, partial [Rickettsiales bacterium]|nr:glutathione synthase [Rickettsiales bacterium]
NGIVSAAVGRIPAAGEVRANFRVGGTAAKAELNRVQERICERVGRYLKENGIVFAGLDLIGDYLTEINITSPTGLRAAMNLYGKNPAIHFWDVVEAKLHSPSEAA